MTIDDITTMIINPNLAVVGYPEKYQPYATIIDETIHERGYSRVLASRYNADNIRLKTDKWLVKNKWNITRLLDILTMEYDPLHNYDGTETTTTHRNPYTDSTNYGQSVVKSDNDISAFNDDSLRRESENTTTSNQHTDTIQYGDYNETVTIEKGGNLGVTTSQQMLTSELNLMSEDNPINRIADMWLDDFTIAYEEG